MNGQDYEQLTLFQEDFPASLFPWLESKKVKGTTVICGLKCSALSESLRRVSSSVRMYLESSALPPGMWSRIWSGGGYNVVVFNFEAAAVGAPHRRSRVFFVGCREVDAEHSGSGRAAENVENAHCGGQREQGILPQQPRRTEFKRNGEDVADAAVRREHRKEPSWQEAWRPCCNSWWAVEPDVGRVAYGVPNRVDRLKCLGNAVVPAQAYPIFAAIAEVIKTINK